ncbi:hypothetical protein SAMN06297422_10747 [Lachnospiraceae bacterium]|nr:hypothetical protein SAMN06297422_10747 [Lachnospiraceae bacterium]
MAGGKKIKNTKRIKSSVRFVLSGLLVIIPFAMSGCGSTDMEALAPARDVPAFVSDKNTVLVEKGDLTPSFERTITLSGYEETIYRLEQNKLDKMEEDYEAVFDELKVDLGDHVSEGDTLISFKSETLDKKLKESQKTKEKALLDIEHFQNLMAINDSLDFSEDIASLENDIYLANVYIEDIYETYNSLNVVAEGDGVVSYVNDTIKDGFIKPGSPLIKVVSSDGYYEMQLNEDEGPNMKKEIGGNATASDAMEISFHVGDRFNAKYALNVYELEVIPGPLGSDSESESDDESEDESEKAKATETDAKEITGNKIYLKLVDDSKISEKELLLYKELPEIKNVCYVDKRAISEYEGEYYVFKQTENELYRAVKVTVGDVVDMNAVILKGLEEGDTVSLTSK